MDCGFHPVLLRTPTSAIRNKFAGSSKGRTAAFGAVNRGSIPRPAAMESRKSTFSGEVHSYFRKGS